MERAPSRTLLRSHQGGGGSACASPLSHVGAPPPPSPPLQMHLYRQVGAATLEGEHFQEACLAFFHLLLFTGPLDQRVLHTEADDFLQVLRCAARPMINDKSAVQMGLSYRPAGSCRPPGVVGSLPRPRPRRCCVPPACTRCSRGRRRMRRGCCFAAAAPCALACLQGRTTASPAHSAGVAACRPHQRLASAGARTNKISLPAAQGPTIRAKVAAVRPLPRRDDLLPQNVDVNPRAGGLPRLRARRALVGGLPPSHVLLELLVAPPALMLSLLAVVLVPHMDLAAASAPSLLLPLPPPAHLEPAVVPPPLPLPRPAAGGVLCAGAGQAGGWEAQVAALHVRGAAGRGGWTGGMKPAGSVRLSLLRPTPQAASGCRCAGRPRRQERDGSSPLLQVVQVGGSLAAGRGRHAAPAPPAAPPAAPPSRTLRCACSPPSPAGASPGARTHARRRCGVVGACVWKVPVPTCRERCPPAAVTSSVEALFSPSPCPPAHPFRPVLTVYALPLLSDACTRCWRTRSLSCTRPPPSQTC